jgi:hypothetical protein
MNTICACRSASRGISRMRPAASFIQPAAIQAARRTLHSRSAMAGGSSTAISPSYRLRSLAPSFIQSESCNTGASASQQIGPSATLLTLDSFPSLARSMFVQVCARIHMVLRSRILTTSGATDGDDTERGFTQIHPRRTTKHERADI